MRASDPADCTRIGASIMTESPSNFIDTGRNSGIMEMQSEGKEENNFFSRVYAVVRKIPSGKVASYGQIARLCGNSRSSRAVGYALHVNPLPGVIPCHRVVNREGRLAPAFAFGGPEVQKELLEQEGVAVFRADNAYYVEIEKYRWNG